MSVVGSAQQKDRPEGDFSLGKYTVRVMYQVQVNSVHDGPQIVLGAPGLPVLYSSYVWGNERNPDMFLMKLAPKPMGTPATLMWTVEATYETLSSKESGGGGRNGGGDRGGGTGRQTPGEFQNPLLELPTVKFHTSGREALLTRIYDNITNSFKPCTASNGEVFDPPPKYLEPFATLEITRNEPIGANQPGIALQYANAVNSDFFWGFPAGYWKVKEVVPERQDRQLPNGNFKFPFLRVTYSFEYNPQTWDIQLLDYGTYYWKRPASVSSVNGQPAGNIPAQRIKITNADGHPTAAPLNGNGQPLPDRVPCTITDGSSTINIAATTPRQQFNVNDTVMLCGMPASGIAKPVAPSPFVYETAYYVVSNTVTSGAQALALSLTLGGNAITAGSPSNQSGFHYMYSPGVFFTVRPYARLPFAALRLPQYFAQVQ